MSVTEQSRNMNRMYIKHHYKMMLFYVLLANYRHKVFCN